MRTIQFAIIALLLAIPLAAVAQVTTATIVGTVTDPGGSIVSRRPGHRAESRHWSHPHRHFKRRGYLPARVSAGRANTVLRFTYSGFKKALVNEVVLQVNDTARVDVALNVGQVSETVTISEMASPAVNTKHLRDRSNHPVCRNHKSAAGWSATSTRCSTSRRCAVEQQRHSRCLNRHQYLHPGYPEQRTLINGGTDGAPGQSTTIWTAA